MSFDSIHNYYEPLVVDYIMHSVAREPDIDENFLEDVACLALNQLPSRYVRHDVDMAFSLTTRERERMQQRITEAVLSAAQKVRDHRRRESAR